MKIIYCKTEKKMALWTVSLFCFLVFIAFICEGFYNAASSSRKKLLPSPSRFPIIGNLHQLGLHPHRSLHLLSKRYGPLFLLNLGSVPVLVVSSADAARMIMKDHDLIFSNRPKSIMAGKLMYGAKDIAFAPYGEYWRQLRSICVLQLLNNKRVRSFRRVREEETTLMVEKIRKSCSSSSSINLTDLLVSLTNDTVCRVALGRKYCVGEEGKTFKWMLREYGDLLGTFFLGDYIPWLAWISKINGLDAKVDKMVKVFDEFLEGIIEEHREQMKGGVNCDEAGGSDFVYLLLEIQTENRAGFRLEADAIKAIILDVFAAGTDTTSTVLVAELLRHPKILEKLQKEVREVAGRKLDITEDDLEKMPFLRAVIKESLRLHTPAPLLVPRESNQSIKLMGYDIAAGTQVLVNAWAIGRDPSLWDNPEEFHPERFFETDIDFKGLNFEFIPFGAGRRGCPGVTFAMAVNELALAKLVHKFNLALPNGGKESDMDMNEGTGITVHKKFPVLVAATPQSG
ncbi:cytochrome P450 71A6-like [Olea europaea subsp. europaea]|uniref:Cytochrome P450 71A6-like n=1 Tax=Olea europaea subsp. europaea TaxID=158383 RepID=A0A8S0PB73_OLEEU|nr:cytochrome P450 71A6-like [Olea europaea subsp. europaea]